MVMGWWTPPSLGICGMMREGGLAQCPQAHGHLHTLGFMAWRGIRVKHTCRGSVTTSIAWDSWHGEGRGCGAVFRVSEPSLSPGSDGKSPIPVLTHAGMPIPMEVISGPAGAAVAAHAVLAAVLARRGLAFICV